MLLWYNLGMAESFNNDKDGPNYRVPGPPNIHNEGNISQGPSMFRKDLARFQNQDAEPIDPNLAGEIAARSNFRAGESLSMEQIAFAESPQELFEGLRATLKRIEDGNVPGSLEDHYGTTRLFGIMRERADLLRMTPKELIDKKWLLDYDAATGIGTPKKRSHASLALSIEETPIRVQDDKGRDRGTVIDIKYNFGTPEKRAELAKAYDRAIAEVEVRAIMGEQVGLRLNPEVRDGLETLVVYLRGGRMPKFKAPHLEAIFNLPDVKDLEKKPENVKLGDQIEEAMFLNLVMLKSGTKKQMKDLLERPGSKFLIAKMAKEYQDKRGGLAYTANDWIQNNIGDVEKWTPDDKRELDTYKKEVELGLREKLTKHSNIAASYGDPGDMGGDDENNFIETTVGGLVGSVEASWIAATMMRVTGAYASEGYVALPNGTSALQLGEDGFISSDDTGKFHAYMQVLKEGLKGRSSFLKDMIGKIPDMSMNLFDWAQVKVKQPDGSIVSRSIWDAWLGTVGGKPITDILTNQPVKGKLTKEEGYHRLGSLNFKSLRRDFHGKFATIQWLIGSGERPTGVLNEALKTDFKLEDFTLNNLKKINKYIGIVFNPIVMTQGSTHLYDTSNLKIVQRNFLRNMMIARIHSQSFSMNILNATIKLFNADGKDFEVPAPLFVKACVEEVLNNSPRTEAELMTHYIDTNKELRSLGKRSVQSLGTENSGTSADVVAVLNEKFVPIIEKEKDLVGHVGRVVGKNVY